MTSVRWGLLAASTLALAGCAVGPDYSRPEPATLGVPATYSRATAPDSGAISEAELATWWQRFNDPVLSSLVEQAVAANLDVAQAAARLKQARESLAQSRAGYAPSVSVAANGGRNVDSDGPDSSSFSLGADASWQIDLFGAISRSVEASRADLAAAGYDLADVRTAIVAQVVTNYIDLRLSQERLRIARETLRTTSDNYDIARWRVQAGLVSSLDSEQARAQLAQQTASIPTIERSIAGSLNRLAVLTGQAPGEVTRPLEAAAPIPEPPTDIATGIPIDTLRQRPDVQASERTLAAATARIGVAEAALYPSLSLTGNVGAGATSLASLMDVITSGVFVRLGQLIFDGGAARSRVRSQQAAAEGAFAAYKSTVLVALEDVENALMFEEASKAREAQFAIAYDAANNSAILARSQYQTGLIDFQTLLNTEQSLLSARDGLASARADEATAVAQLYSALGGGWQSMDGRNMDGGPQ